MKVMAGVHASYGAELADGGGGTTCSAASVEDLGEQIAELASTLFAGEAQLLALIGEFDALDGWADGSTRSCAHWLNWRLGIGMTAARERVRVARSLRQLRAVADAFGAGRLSYSKVRAITRIATAETEDVLLGLALSTTAAQLEQICRRWRQHQRQSVPDAADRQRHDQHLVVGDSEDGMTRLTGLLDAPSGAVVRKALAAAGEQLFAEQGPASEDAAGQRLADALVLVCEAFLAHGAPEQPSDVWQITVTADADTIQDVSDGVARDPRTYEEDRSGSGAGDGGLARALAKDPTAAPPAVTTDDGRTLPGPVVRRLACDRQVQTIVRARDGAHLGVGRRHRLVPRRVRRLLFDRDADGCQAPGCPNRRWTEAHHVIHWIDGGPTDLDNLVRVCGFHHSVIHNRGYALAHDIRTRRWTLVDAQGRQVPAVVSLPRPAPDRLPEANGLSRWNGDTADLHLIIEAMAEAAGADPSAESSALGGRSSRPDSSTPVAAPEGVGLVAPHDCVTG